MGSNPTRTTHTLSYGLSPGPCEGLVSGSTPDGRAEPNPRIQALGVRERATKLNITIQLDGETEIISRFEREVPGSNPGRAAYQLAVDSCC